jgi:putative transposase
MSQSCSNNYVHAVFSTKGRRNSIPPDLEERLYPFIAAVSQKHNIPVLTAGGMPNHCHLLFRLPANVALAVAMNTLKANSSRFLGRGFQWQSGYGAFRVSCSQIEQVTAYIQRQPEHHRKMTFEEEFLALLKRAGVPYDSKYIFG